MRYRSPSFDPFALVSLAFEQQRLIMSAWQTIWLRTADALAGTMSQKEIATMWSEKPVAMAKSLQKSASAAMRNRPPVEIARQAIRPLERKASSNAKRLARRKRKG